MKTLLVLFATLARLVTPSRGAHTSPFGYLREVLAEARTRRRAARVRRYAHDVPTVAEVTPALPRVPALRRAPDAAPVAAPASRPGRLQPFPVVDPREVETPAAMVRGPFRHWEARQDAARVDRSRLGVAVLRDLAANRTGVSA